jgi:hypothetical protein
MLSVLCAYRKLLLAAQVQAQQDALEARSLPDQDQFTVVCERDGLPAADTAVAQAVRVDKEEAIAVSNTRHFSCLSGGAPAFAAPAPTGLPPSFAGLQDED